MLALSPPPPNAIDRGAGSTRPRWRGSCGSREPWLARSLDLTLLGPDIQEAIPALEAVDGRNRPARGS
jgi:hypothetical protein